MDSPRTPLGVELLAEAMAAFMTRPPGWLVVPNADDAARARESFRYAAKRIAAEYLRLQSTDPSLSPDQEER